MSRARQVWSLVILLCLTPMDSAARIFPWDDYGPACQWLRLVGEIERPADLAADKPVQLTVTYRLEDQETPTTLLTNYPITKSRFAFVLAGFGTDIQDVIFVPPMFFFSDWIEFQYFAGLPGGKRLSEYRRIVYHPQRIKKDGQVLCQTGIQLETLKLSER